MALIALGVTGGIGAYKAVEVCRGLQKRGHDVVAVMTRSATRFVGPLTFEAITRHPVITSQFGPMATSGSSSRDIEHIAVRIARRCSW
jgi:phosphopantothenoylcysteine decarboxylase/phosphopantothenate--cysteine ligase